MNLTKEDRLIVIWQIIWQIIIRKDAQHCFPLAN